MNSLAPSLETVGLKLPDYFDFRLYQEDCATDLMEMILHHFGLSEAQRTFLLLGSLGTRMSGTDFQVKLIPRDRRLAAPSEVSKGSFAGRPFEDHPGLGIVTYLFQAPLLCPISVIGKAVIRKLGAEKKRYG
ncbi:MAG: hypothetical protein WCA95_15385, partial [Opitutaceae bacterium]